MKLGTVLRPLDYAAIGLALSVTILSAVLVYAGTGAYDRVIIKGAGEQWVFPQGAAELIRVVGPLGDTVVELRDHTVMILASPCVNQTCVAAGAIHSHGQWIACLPNQVLVSIQRGTNPGPTPQGTELDAAAW